ncbi:MAG: hypothetical protein DMG07_11820, partial [Acidobacteria bacterium]
AAERLDCAGQERGYTPPWLRELAREAARSIPARVAGPSVLQEQLERALELSWSDQGAFLGADVAAVNLGSISDDTALRLRRARFDAIDNMRLSSFAVYGRTAEKILRTLDELPERPSGMRSPVRIAGNRYLPENAMVRLLCFHIANHRSASARMTGELLGFLGAFLPLALGYATILLCGRIRMLPRYSYYPGTGKDPVLDNPSWGTIGSVVVVVAASAVILGLARRLLFWKLPEPDFFGAKTVELALLVVIVVAALEHNPYWAVVFFALPAWIWGLVGEGEEVGARAANRIAILGAGII